MNKFNGKMLEVADTNSEMTTQTKRTTKSSQGEKKTPKGTRYGSPGADELDEAATLMPGQTLNERDPNFDGEFDMRGGMDEDEAMEEDRVDNFGCGNDGDEKQIPWYWPRRYPL